jgi:hypothetical protein
MASAYEELLRIVDSNTAPDRKVVAMRGFAEELQWTPSYEFQASFGIEAAGDHLIVEHGLDNSAIISFLKSPYRASDLTQLHLRSLLGISYNNLVEWHLFVSQTDIRRINNLADPTSEPNADRTFPLSQAEFAQRLSSTELDRLQTTEGVKRTLRACDDAFIQVLSRWKRMLNADYPAALNVNISTLFNAFIFVRGCEDRNLDRVHRTDRMLLSLFSAEASSEVNLAAMLDQALKHAGVDSSLSDYVNVDHLGPFAAVDKATALNLCRDFYAPPEAPYDFNFALMSKHALSRIYERYVALLKSSPEQEQLYFVSPTPTEESPNRTGSIYTPQFIAGFFARYIWQNTTPRRFRTIRSIDPACGSGIFLRTLLELQCNPLTLGTTPTSIREAFGRAVGIDKDANAIEATRLSLALLHLVATGELPRYLNVTCSDAISDAVEGRLEVGTYGAVITNPPYIKYDFLGDAQRELYRKYLGDQHSGRLDAYLPFVKLCLGLMEPDGFVCMVLPQAFLSARNAAPLRRMISNDYDVRCLVDLSSVRVFENVGAYSILLVVQRRQALASGMRPMAYIAQVTEFVGAALQACLDSRSTETPYHRVFPVNQNFFLSRDWVLVSPSHLAIDDHLERLPRLSTVVKVFQGFVTGADDVFILSKELIPPGEEEIYLDYLPDREIGRYRIPSRVDQAVIYPYQGNIALTEGTFAERYPKTWRYLLKNKPKLESRGPVRAGKTPWWRPERPREPERIRRPKIVCPHLMLTPRFALDGKGHLAVSRAPFMIAEELGDELTLLRFLCAVLNSSVSNWYLQTYAPKYAHGYNRLEADLLKSIPIPDIRKIDPAELRRIASAVERLQSGRGGGSLDSETDALIVALYDFSSNERKHILGTD